MIVAVLLLALKGGAGIWDFRTIARHCAATNCAIVRIMAGVCSGMTRLPRHCAVYRLI